MLLKALFAALALGAAVHAAEQGYPNKPVKIIVTFAPGGIPELKNFVVENYYGFMAPAAAPKEVQAKIEADLKRVLSNQDLLARMANAGLDVFQRSPQEMRELYRLDIEKFARAAAVAGIKPE